MLRSLARLNGVGLRRGAVLIGRKIAVLCAGPTEVLMAHSARGSYGGEQACLRCCWGGGDHACTRRRRRVVCGRVSRVTLWRALGMVAKRLGMAWACGLVAGIARGRDREWQWGASFLPDKVGEASVARSLLSTMGWQWCSRPAHH